jgi:ferrous iron transport protein B
MRIAVAGNPNVGKTSLFNVLTGSRHRVGNYPGVTVERREGVLDSDFGGGLTLVDLPGTYSLTAISEDEAVAFDVLSGKMGSSPDVILLVLDASNLARNLYLALQVLELGLPVVVALNMVDVAREAGLEVEPAALADELGVPVVPTVARVGEGAKEIVEALRGAAEGTLEPLLVPPREGDAELREALQSLSDLPPERARWLLATSAARRLDQAHLGARERALVDSLDHEHCVKATEQLVAARYARVDALLLGLGRSDAREGGAPAMARSDRVDQILTDPFMGVVAFIGIMAIVFISIFWVAEPFMGLIEEAIGFLSEVTASALGPGLFTDLLTEGVIAGAGNVLVFIPQIALLFLFIGLLEDSGYMARAAFLLDRLMSRLGLHGNAFIPLLSGYACAIPAVMGTRTISSFKDRLVTILMIPYMSCSARLPIYALIIGALFVGEGTTSTDRGLVLLSMYLLSTVSALAMGFIYKRTLLRSPTPPLVLELPPYRIPRFKNIGLQVYARTKDFVKNAGTVILAFTILLWAALSFPRDATQAGGEGPTIIAESYGGRLARSIEPALEPIGQDWRVGVGIIGSFAAREVLVSTLGLVYGMEADEDDPVELRAAIRNDRDPQTGRPKHTKLSGLALMVFFVYACMCMSTLAVVRRETRSWKWPIFMFVSMTTIAYVAALVVYQGGRLLGFE